ncbi:MAG TPA: serine/threonine-protein kinase [Kofleriaceae bacterium]|nr:serine/threonine-protein kinase [Kofleriaceae bacterium]
MSERPRTLTRLRFVAPPGMALEESQGEVKTIGRYEILETLGKGAMGVVYKARDPLLDRIVAVKTLVSPRAGGRRTRRAYLERFEREAKAAAKMQHPAIVTIFDVGLEENGAPYMVLEYLPGESLADRLDQIRMPLGRAVQVGQDLASALAFAHRQRIVHRDVKPANVLHAGETRWKLADFGIARLPDSDLTQVGIFMGTPGYAPPEAISQGRYTSQADVFAWGAVLYELLSGRIPYEGPDTRTTNGYVLKTTAKSPRDYDASIPEPLAEVVMQALHPSTDVRFKDGAEAEGALKRAWDECLTNEMVLLPSLTGPEMTHDRITATMHHTVALRSKSRAAKAPQGLAPAAAAAAERLVISTTMPSHSVGDDDPTRILNRVPDGPSMEPASASGSDTSRRAVEEWSGSAYHQTVEESNPFGKGRGIEHDRTLPDAGRAEAIINRDLLRQSSRRRAGPAQGQGGQALRVEDVVRQQPARQAGRQAPLPPSSPARIGLWIVVLLLAVAAGAGAAYWVIGAL